jgi:hypothetical protein
MFGDGGGRTYERDGQLYALVWLVANEAAPVEAILRSAIELIGR